MNKVFVKVKSVALFFKLFRPSLNISMQPEKGVRDEGEKEKGLDEKRKETGNKGSLTKRMLT